MKKNYFIFLVLGALCCALITVSCSNNKKQSGENIPEKPVPNEDLVKRGEYLVTIMGCNDCHSPKKNGAKRT